MEQMLRKKKLIKYLFTQSNRYFATLKYKISLFILEAQQKSIKIKLNYSNNIFAVEI